MPERTNLNIKYLIDENSNLTELVRRNYGSIAEQQKYNLYQVQNIFKSGESLNISLFDNQNPSKQSNLEGAKTIFAGGFRFHPILWKTGSYDLIYNADQNIYPQGIINNLNLNEYNIVPDFQAGGLFQRSRLKFRAEKVIGGPSAFDVRVSATITLDFGLFAIPVSIPYVLVIPAGKLYSDWSPELKGVNFWSIKLENVQEVNGNSSINYTIVDSSTSNHLSMSINDSSQTIISCSAKQTQFYPNWSFSGSVASPIDVEYNFTLKKGRFS